MIHDARDAGIIHKTDILLNQPVEIRELRWHLCITWVAINAYHARINEFGTSLLAA